MADDKKFDLSRRKVLGSIGTIGVASAAAGAGTMAVFNDTEESNNNTVTAGKLDLQIDWWQKYHQGMAGRGSDHSGLTNNPGPIFEISDAKPGDWGCGLISLHLFNNPAYVWAGCDLEEWEKGRNEPEKEVDDTPHKGELAENIKVALVRFPRKAGSTEESTDQDPYINAIEQDPEGRDFSSMSTGKKVYQTTLKDLCENKLHGGHLLDGKKNRDGIQGRCFRNSSTYFYGFVWWIPKHVGNVIQSDKAKFALKFGAAQCRHIKNPGQYNPFANS